MKVLIVGAGAVGQVYARHLQLGGAEVAFFVKPGQVERAARGFDLYPLNRRRPRREPVTLQAPVVSAMDEAMAARPNVVLLCVSSAALRAGAWLDELGAHLGEATVVALQPSPGDLALVAARAPADQVVAGLIGILSYAGPLPGETLPRPGTVYWFPPLTRSVFSGSDERTRPLVDAFRRGGLPAKIDPDAPSLQAFGTAVLQPVVMALEIAGWSLRALRRDAALVRLAHEATREAIAAVSRRDGTSPPLAIRLARPLFLRLGLGMAGLGAPLDIEGFLRVHFSKVGDQTRLWLDEVRELAAAEGVSERALAELGERLAEAS